MTESNEQDQEKETPQGEEREELAQKGRLEQTEQEEGDEPTAA
jgi:hypothetical protein